MREGGGGEDFEGGSVSWMDLGNSALRWSFVLVTTSRRGSHGFTFCGIKF